MAFNSSNFVQVGINMVLRDQFSQNAGRVTSAFQTMMNNLQAAGRAVQASYGEIFNGALNGAKAVFNAYKAYAGVQKDIFLTGKMADATEEQIKGLRDLAEKTNLEVPLTTGDIASAEKFLAMAGNSVEQIQNMIPSVSKLASIFSMEAGGKGGVADLMTNIMSMYQVASENADTVANDLYVATTSANMSLQDLANSIKYAGAEMATMGYGIKETAAAIGLLGDMGIQGSAAGTALANTMRYLRKSIAGSKESGAKALQRLGLSKEDFLDARGEMKDLYSVYKTLAKAIEDKGISGNEAANLINDIVGVRGARNLMSVIRQINSGNDTYAKIMRNYEERQGALDKTMKEYQESPQGRLDQFKSTIDAITQRLGQFAADFLTPIMTGVNWVLKQLYNATSIPFVGWLIKGGLFVTFVSPLIVGAKMFATLIATLKETIIMTNAALQRLGISAKAMAQNQMAVQHMLTQAGALGAGQKMYIGPDAYLYKNNKGNVALSYMGVGKDGKPRRRSTSNQNKIQQWALSQDRRGAGQKNTFGAWGGKGFAGGLAKVGSGLGKLAGGLASFMMGPWGIAIMGIATLLPGILDAIRGNTDTQRESLEEQRKKIRDMSTQEYFAYREKKFIEAYQKALGKAVGTVTVNINGQSVNASAGDTVTVDDLSNITNILTDD